MERKTIVYNDKDDTLLLSELEEWNRINKPPVEEKDFEYDDFFKNGDFDYVGSSYNYDNYYNDYKDESSKKKKSNKKSNKKKYIFIGGGIFLILVLLGILFMTSGKEIIPTNEEHSRTILSDTNWATEQDTIIEFGVPNEYEGYKEYYTNNPYSKLCATYNILYDHEADLILDYYGADKKEIEDKIVEHYDINSDGFYFIMSLAVTTDVDSMNRDDTNYYVFYRDSIMYCYDLSTGEFSKLYRDNEKHSISNAVEEDVEEPTIEEDTSEEETKPVLDENFKKAQEEKAKKDKERLEEAKKKKEQEEKEKQEQTQTQPEEQQFQIINNTGDDNSTEGDNNN